MRLHFGRKNDSNLESCRVVIRKLFIKIKIVLSNPLKFKETEVEERLYDKQTVFLCFYKKKLTLSQRKTNIINYIRHNPLKT